MSQSLMVPSTEDVEEMVVSTAAAAAAASSSSSSSSSDARLTTTSPESSRVPFFNFLPDFTEHPKPKRRQSSSSSSSITPSSTEPLTRPQEDDSGEDVTFFHDFVAGGVAGSASVIVGHPFDTIKVRIQTASAQSAAQNASLRTMINDFGGVASLFRGLAAPLSSAAVVNAVVFGSYGTASRWYDEYIQPYQPFSYSTYYNNSNTALTEEEEYVPSHDPWQKSLLCGSFAGLVQCVIICPMEHIKCRLQVQPKKGAVGYRYKGPAQLIGSIHQHYGFTKLYQGWWSTVCREIPAFGLYFCSYDYLKDKANAFLAPIPPTIPSTLSTSYPTTSHTWLASAWAGGTAGSLTWLIVYPVDVIKTRIQTAPLSSSAKDLRMFRMGRMLVAQYGWKYLFRGLGITLIRAFPVNGTIFPVYEFTLQQVMKWENGR